MKSFFTRIGLKNASFFLNGIMFFGWCLVSITNCDAQYNYVQNPSFEAHDTCPTWIAQINYATYWKGLGGSPDYMHTCANPSIYIGVPVNGGGTSYQIPRTGEGYATLGLYATLTTIPNSCYIEEMNNRLVKY